MQRNCREQRAFAAAGLERLSGLLQVRFGRRKVPEHGHQHRLGALHQGHITRRRNRL